MAVGMGRGGSLRQGVAAVALAAGIMAGLGDRAMAAGDAAGPDAALAKIKTVVVIYAENRGFDNLYGTFPGANGIANAPPDSLAQRDRDGSVLKELPPIWKGLTARGVTPEVTQAQTEHLPNQPFAIDDPQGFNLGQGVVTRDLVHRFYENQMQIDGGKNDKFVAYADSGALVMGHYDGAKQAMWTLAREYTLADNFFMGGFGGSFFNHFVLICSCAPYYPHADQGPAKGSISVVEPDRVSLTLAPNSPKSAIEGVPKFVNSGNLTPDFYAVNTMQPPFQPSANKPAQGGDPALADPANPTTLPPQTMTNIGDLLSQKKVSWAWYSGAWQATLDHGNAEPVPNFQYHHQPFNYFASTAPGTKARKEHLRDGGLEGQAFIKDIDAGTLPTVTFYKPQGNLTQHSGYADVASGDAHIADIVAHLRKSPQWKNMLVVVTYDENGGYWDHVTPPKGDRWGPGTRIPAIIISPYAKKGYIDHTFYDTTSILRFITRRFDLPKLEGIKQRDAALAANGSPALGDLTGALDFAQK
ncbi:acid phosphatase [Nitrospirillum sp. BR 11164]|uniref:acid phosphatase n=1 Tax=Nitrospirillum sp. BR 11164 TaxID=3104324 RepID=UPI002AFFCEE1|nr:acid phosphatase [Nitrospirillum sp. BR 11164]MEA1652633.1 acid phosphatase [Nitrospirillum sp. BR 11164]